MINATEAKKMVDKYNEASSSDFTNFIANIGLVISNAATNGHSSVTITQSLTTVEKMFRRLDSIEYVKNKLITDYGFTVDLEDQENVRESVMRIYW
jgi:hypothetical protein